MNTLTKPLLIVAVAFDILVIMAFVVIVVFNIWHPAEYAGSVESRLMDTWFAAGLIPAVVITFGACFLFDTYPPKKEQQ